MYPSNTIEIVHIGATWRIRLNPYFLRPTRLHSPNGKSIGSAISAHFTAESPYTLQWANLSPKLPLLAFSLGIWTPSNTWFPRPESSAQTASRSVQSFLHSSHARPVTPGWPRNGIVCCGLATAHTLLCTLNGDDSSSFSFFLSLAILTFDL